MPAVRANLQPQQRDWLELGTRENTEQAGDPGREAETRGWRWNEGHSWDAHRVLGGGVGIPSFC